VECYADVNHNEILNICLLVFYLKRESCRWFFVDKARSRRRAFVLAVVLSRGGNGVELEVEICVFI
jgi:hypothetical protein